MNKQLQGYFNRPHDILFLIFWAFCFCIIGIGKGSLASWDEAYYALASKSIYETGEWIFLTQFGSPFYDKPPLYFWMSAIFYHLFGGVTEFSSRLMSGLAGIGTVIGTYYIGKHFFGRFAGLAGAGVLFSSTDFMNYARWGTLDITNLCFFTLAILGFIKAKKNDSFYLLFWLGSALSFMTKGPLIVLAWIILALYVLINFDFSFLKNKKFYLGILLFIGLILPWHVLIYLRSPETFWDQFIYKHYISRTSTVLDGHVGNYYYYIRTLINKYHPWVILAAYSLPLMIWRIFKSDKKKEHLFLMVWILVVFSFFTFCVQTKLKWYILPLHPALSLTVGLVLVQWIRDKSEWWLKSTIIITLLCHIPFSSVLVHDFVPGIKSFTPIIQENRSQNEITYLYQYHDQPAANFYWERPVEYIDTVEGLDKKILEYKNKKEDLWIFIQKERYESVIAVFKDRKFVTIHSSDGFKDDVMLIKKGYSG